MKKFYETEAEFLRAQEENRRMARNLFYESKKLKYANAFVSTCSCNYAEALYDGAHTIGDLCDRLDAIVPELADKFWAALEPSFSKEKKTLFEMKRENKRLQKTVWSLRAQISKMKSDASWDDDIRRGQVQGMW